MQFGNDVWQDEAKGVSAALLPPDRVRFPGTSIVSALQCAVKSSFRLPTHIFEDAVFRWRRWSIFCESGIFWSAASTSYPVASSSRWRSAEHCSRAPSYCYWISRSLRSISRRKQEILPFEHAASSRNCTSR